jgi:hypothetical protein
VSSSEKSGTFSGTCSHQPIDILAIVAAELDAAEMNETDRQGPPDLIPTLSAAHFSRLLEFQFIVIDFFEKVSQVIIFIDTEKHEPIAPILSDDHRVTKGDVAKLRKLPDQFARTDAHGEPSK